MAIAIGHWFAFASRSAAAMMVLAIASEIGGPYGSGRFDAGVCDMAVIVVDGRARVKSAHNRLRAFLNGRSVALRISRLCNVSAFGVTAAPGRSLLAVQRSLSGLKMRVNSCRRSSVRSGAGSGCVVLMMRSSRAAAALEIVERRQLIARRHGNLVQQRPHLLVGQRTIDALVAKHQTPALLGTAVGGNLPQQIDLRASPPAVRRRCGAAPPRRLHTQG